MKTFSEVQREREVQRLYHGWQSAQGSSLNVALNVESIAEADLHGNGYKPQASQDSALTAFAQLAVLKLGVRRAMVSLIDTDTQMILAESTDTVGIGSGCESDLWLGSTVLVRSDAVCEHAMCNTYTAHDPADDSISYTAPALVVPDCRLDSRFETRPYVVSEPGVRFYAGVPIVSPVGHRVGVYAVSDESPRHGLSIEELKFMEGVASTVMDHLEAARDRVDRFKGERIVRGLAAFIEGPSTEGSSLGRHPSTKSTSSRRRALARQASYSRHDLEIDQRARGQAIQGTEDSTNASQPADTAAQSVPTPTDGSNEKAQAKGDALSLMYSHAAETMRQSTLADGVVVFGASPSNSKQSLKRTLAGGLRSSFEDDVSTSMTSGSEGFGLDSSDSDASPSARPCKVLACALADMKARADIEQGSALTLGALEKYFHLFPRGKTFSFSSEGTGISSEEDSASDREPAAPSSDSNETTDYRRRRPHRMDHKELLKKIPGARVVVFVPLYSNLEDRLAGGCFLWTSVTGRMMNMDDDLSYLRAFSNSIMSEVGRINAQKDEAAKTTFIASISHELRSPLHGILGAAEFLLDTAVDSYQSGLITSVSTCGKTLLDTMNHLLDYSKINRLGPKQIRKNARRKKLADVPAEKSLESLNVPAVVDLAVLVEEVVDAVTAGNTFDKLPGTAPSRVSKSNAGPSVHSSLIGQQASASSPEESVSVLLDICPRASWMVRTQPGALRRIVMNLLGNALKYTSSGFVQVSLRAQDHGSKANPKTAVVIKVADSGKGMSQEFQRDRLFVPFSQEDSFQPGTGLGLSIVKQIVDSLGGSIELKSEHQKGTEVVVRLSLNTVTDGSPSQPDEEMHSITRITEGKNVTMLDSGIACDAGHQSFKLDQSLAATCSEWFGLNVSRDWESDDDADIYVYSGPPTVEALRERFQQRSNGRQGGEPPVVIVCPNAKEAIRVSQNQSRALVDLGRIVEVIPQPCGPRKLAKVLSHCLSRRDEPPQPFPDSGDAAPQKPKSEVLQPEDEKSTCAGAPTVSVVENHGSLPQTPESEENQQPFEAEVNLKPPGTKVKLTQPSPPPVDPSTPPLEEEIQEALDRHDKSNDSQPAQPHVLLVDDNHINLQLLVMLMKKCNCTFVQAENGQEALNQFIQAHEPTASSASRPFDYILMDINMPVMNGLDATRRIRELEREKKLARANVIALTGLASDDAQRDAKGAGVDVFLPKPVRFAELKKILVPAV